MSTLHRDNLGQGTKTQQHLLRGRPPGQASPVLRVSDTKDEQGLQDRRQRGRLAKRHVILTS